MVHHKLSPFLNIVKFVTLDAILYHIVSLTLFFYKYLCTFFFSNIRMSELKIFSENVEVRYPECFTVHVGSYMQYIWCTDIFVILD